MLREICYGNLQTAPYSTITSYYYILVPGVPRTLNSSTPKVSGIPLQTALWSTLIDTQTTRANPTHSSVSKRSTQPTRETPKQALPIQPTRETSTKGLPTSCLKAGDAVVPYPAAATKTASPNKDRNRCHHTAASVAPVPPYITTSGATTRSWYIGYRPWKINPSPHRKCKNWNELQISRNQ